MPSTGIRPEDALLLAEHDGELIGIDAHTGCRSSLCHPASNSVRADTSLTS